MLHRLGVVTKVQCLRSGNVLAECGGYDAGVHNQAVGLSPSHFAYVLVVNGDRTAGVGGAQFGITYPGVYSRVGNGHDINVFSWQNCADLENPSLSPAWPRPGSGNLVTYAPTSSQCVATPGNAVVGGVGVMGYFYLAAYAPGLLRLTPRPSDGLARVTDCHGVVQNVFSSSNDAQTFLGAIGFGQPGINPCGRVAPIAVESATWSGVKALTSD